MVVEKLERPPVVEVICGLWFDAVPAIDPVLLGAFWMERRERFPHHELLPAIEASGLRIGPPNQRVWLRTQDETYVLQVQNDRVYLNWRARGSEYPRFSPPGALKEQFLEEWRGFLAFCGRVGVEAPVPRVAEVGKIDHLPRTHASQLGEWMPSLAGMGALIDDAEGAALLRVSNGRPPESTSLVLGTARTRDGGQSAAILRLETNATRPVSGGDLATALDEANQRVNELFGALIPGQIRRQRFGGEAP